MDMIFFFSRENLKCFLLKSELHKIDKDYSDTEALTFEQFFSGQHLITAIADRDFGFPTTSW